MKSITVQTRGGCTVPVWDYHTTLWDTQDGAQTRSEWLLEWCGKTARKWLQTQWTTCAPGCQLQFGRQLGEGRGSRQDALDWQWQQPRRLLALPAQQQSAAVAGVQAAQRRTMLPARPGWQQQGGPVLPLRHGPCAPLALPLAAAQPPFTL